MFYVFDQLVIVSLESYKAINCLRTARCVARVSLLSSVFLSSPPSRPALLPCSLASLPCLAALLRPMTNADRGLYLQVISGLRRRRVCNVFSDLQSTRVE